MMRRRSGVEPVLWPDQDQPEPMEEHGRPEGRPDDRGRPSGRPHPLLRWRTWAAVGIGAALAVQSAWAVSLGLAHRPALDELEVRQVAARPPSRVLTPVAPVQPPAGATAGARAGTTTSGPRPGDLRSWAESLSGRVGIPAVALAAYGTAERVLGTEDPGCHLSWVALAGIGRIESDHGRFGGATLLPDGRSQPPVIGIALDGQGVATIRDSDHGRLDGDPVHDRAVGPMQFIPTTWARYATDADGDGRADPFALPDAALAAGRYLCRAGDGDLRTARAWSAAVLAYNASGSYLRQVTENSNRYAVASFG